MKNKLASWLRKSPEKNDILLKYSRIKNVFQIYLYISTKNHIKSLSVIAGEIKLARRIFQAS